MTTPPPPTDRFRSATEFPKTTQTLERSEADTLYEEMRDCLVFTNRSRAQLIRRNQEHKEKTGLLKEDVQRLQTMIHQLTSDKQQNLQEQQHLINALETEMTAMASRLDELAVAFDGVSDVETADQAYWGFVAMPGRLVRFIRAVKAVVTWWRQEESDRSQLPPSQSALDKGEDQDDGADRRDRPQMHTDPASINRSLLDQ